MDALYKAGILKGREWYVNGNKTGLCQSLDYDGSEKSGLTTPLFPQQKTGEKDATQDLQARQQSLQNSILLLKSTTDGAAGTPEMQEVLQEKLKEITAELKAAKAQEPQAAVSQPVKERFDRYETGAGPIDSPGLYQKDGENGYHILFSPYAEQQ